MTTKLDASHKCVIENWQTLNRMIACRDQVELYVKDIARRAFHGLKPKYQDLFDVEDGISKGVWFQLNRKSLLNWNGGKDHFWAIGVEGFEVRTILQPGSDAYCNAYFYSNYLADKNAKNRDEIRNAVIKAVTPPKDFVLGDPKGGYVFERHLPALAGTAFEDAAQLESYFREPMLLLIEWWRLNDKALSNALGKAKRS